MSYTRGATSLNLGNQQVTVHPYQELLSLNANKTFLGIIPSGVYTAQVEIQDGITDVKFIIKKGTTFIFSKFDQEHNSKMLGKITLQDDAEIIVSKASLLGLATDALLIVASWEYSINDATNIYTNLRVMPYDASNIADIESYQDLIIAVILNHNEFVANGGNPAYYRISYQEQSNRNVFLNVFSVGNNFPITFGHSGESILVGTGSLVLEDTVIYNKNTLTASIANGNWPTPVSTVTPNNYYQIDVLRLKVESPTNTTKVPYLGWESFLKEKPMIDKESFIDGYNFVWKDKGYTLLIAIRDRGALLSTTPIFPQDCIIINPFTPRIEVPETSSRFKFPVY